ncbi:MULTISPECIES: DUF3334 family protein [unclassified Anaerobiospirillum]|uniref:DUF3334 family protein n=1 Tax=unclassified Anaerobiospirillum TaxID=2647410 RepID=UPI001FF580D1|nr:MULTISPECIES: DUF3334 family protein [unclassified Anaerobiospirillum]MCK0525543.1 DUF3334 family protein [Anaerobiospirillum sp. NML120449]MCK0535374.1 DUF3334 family protein [Anaerobiospirillum sp. NML120511]MCK0539066.1 DUF3334 family protein [Anaerobiospirillum sp. NML02-A-032]
MLISKHQVITCDDILLSLCDSVCDVLTAATNDKVSFTPMIQKINNTTLRPDIGTFVLFTGTFSGMVVLNFPKETAMELYSNYMKLMGLSDNDLATNYTSEEVSNTLGELMNQMVGNFTAKMSTTLNGRIHQSQPKMLSLPHQVEININMTLDHPEVSRITFFTAFGNAFYLELAMDHTEFKLARDLEPADQPLTPEEIMAQAGIV